MIRLQAHDGTAARALQAANPSLTAGTPSSQDQPGKRRRPTFETLLRAATPHEGEKLDARDASSTLFRFFRSSHVTDLRIIATGAFAVGAVCLAVLGLLLSVSPFVNKDSLLVSLIHSYAGPTVALCCVVVGWAYRSASARLGVVDLFACEIATLCRVGTIFDIALRYVNRIDEPGQGATVHRPMAPGNGSFVSQEHYFPVFDSNSRDLQLLEAEVVGSVVEFYTYMKATRDVLRRLGQLDVTGSAQPGPGTAEMRKTVICDLIYMVFLAFESARKSIRALVEFEPSEADYTMIVLLTELKAYDFLLRRFAEEELFRRRLELRKDDYKLERVRLNCLIECHRGEPHWNKAVETAPSLDPLFEQVIGPATKSSSDCRCQGP